MNAFATLRPSERRLVIWVSVGLFVLFNWVWVVPHFSDWSATSKRMSDARWTIETYQKEINKLDSYKRAVDKLQDMGTSVPPEDQAIQFARTIQSEAGRSHVTMLGNSRSSVRTNQFFIEQFQTISVLGEEKNLVDFLYNLGEGNSLIRVRGLSVRPDAPRQQLSATVTLVASYQKNQAAPKPAAAPVPAAPEPAVPAPVIPTAPAATPPGVPPMKVRAQVPGPSNSSTNQSKPATVRVAPVKK